MAVTNMVVRMAVERGLILSKNNSQGVRGRSRYGTSSSGINGLVFW